MAEYRLSVEEEVIPGNLPEGWPLFFVDCENDDCEAVITVSYKGAPPHQIACPDCGCEIVIYKCLNCDAHYEKSDQAFISCDVPYGSTVADSIFGPAYFCSSKCIVEAFSKDDFNAKSMWA
jgi:hypothetical protein